MSKVKEKPIDVPIEAEEEKSEAVAVEKTREELEQENEQLRKALSSMTVAKEELPPTPKQFLDDDEWHYYLCIQSKADEEDELADKCSNDPLRGGYTIAPGGRISARKTWLRIPQALFKSRKQAGIDEAKTRWQRPQGQDVRDVGLVQQHERVAEQR